MWKKLLCLVLAMVMTLGILPCVTFAAEVVSNGTCGDNLTWTLNDSGTLTISGTGEMTNRSSSSSVPWYESRSSIKEVVIENGVTSIGSYAFYGCTSLTSVKISDSVTSIGDYAFNKCCNPLQFANAGDCKKRRA